MVHMKEFIYVFNKENRDKMLDLGFVLLKNDEKNSVFVFKSNEKLAFELFTIKDFVESNILTF